MGMSCIMESNFGKSQHFDLSVENSPDIAFVCGIRFLCISKYSKYEDDYGQ